MSQNTARILFLVSLFLFALVGLNLTSLFSGSDKPKTNNLVSTNETGQVLPGNSSPTVYYKFYLKDASVLGAVLNVNSENSTSYLTGATAVVLNQSSFHCGDNGSNYAFTDYSGLYKIVCQEEGTMQVQISKDGYVTKTASLSPYTGEIPTITLSKYVPPPPPPPSVKDVDLPKVFTKDSTNLGKIKNTKKVKDFTLDTKKATIKFKETLNLSSSSLKDKFKKLDKYVKMTETGVVGLDSKSLSVLNKKAEVKMKSLPWVLKPRVLVDGKENPKVVTNIKYEKGILSFDAAHFSTFKAAPSIVVSEPVNNFEVNEEQLKLQGVVSDTTASVSATFNGQKPSNLKVATDSGKFAVTFNLVEGYNQIVLKALSPNGTGTTAEIIGTFVRKSNNLYLYVIIGLLVLISVGSMIYTFKVIKKTKPVNTSSADTKPQKDLQ